MSRLLTFATVIALLFALVSCTTATAPVGESPLRVDPSEWEGTWTALAEENRWEVSIGVTDAENGVLEVTGLFEEDGSRERTVYLREGGGWVFASTLDDRRAPESEDSPPRYQWARIDANPSRILLWAPVFEKFRDLIDEGRLPAPESGSGANLGSLRPEDYELLTSEDAASLFEWDDPGIFVRD